MYSQARNLTQAQFDAHQKRLSSAFFREEAILPYDRWDVLHLNQRTAMVGDPQREMDVMAQIRHELRPDLKRPEPAMPTPAPRLGREEKTDTKAEDARKSALRELDELERKLREDALTGDAQKELRTRNQCELQKARISELAQAGWIDALEAAHRVPPARNKTRLRRVPKRCTVSSHLLMCAPG